MARLDERAEPSWALLRGGTPDRTNKPQHIDNIRRLKKRARCGRRWDTCTTSAKHVASAWTAIWPACRIVVRPVSERSIDGRRDGHLSWIYSLFSVRCRLLSLVTENRPIGKEAGWCSFSV
jgi:hypothetical protein